MKNKVKIILAVLLSLTVVVCLTACGPSYDGRDDFYQAYEITKVNVEQKSTSTYNFLVTSDIAPSSNAKVYVTHYEAIPKDATAISYTNDNGSYSFTANVSYDRYYIHIVDGDKTAVLSMNRPQMTPTLQTQTDGVPAKVITYNFINGTSWSSFCDPTGKAVYKSSKPYFDDDATVVAQNVQLAGVDSTTDVAPQDDEPYYFVVLTAKNGIVTYVSAPIMDANKAFSDLAVSLQNDNGTPVLVATGRFIIGGDVALQVYSADSRLGKIYNVTGSSVTGNAGDEFRTTIDLSQIVVSSGAGVWFDIKLRTGTGANYDLSDGAADMAQTLKNGTTTFEFKEYDHILKINYAFYDFDVSRTYIDTSDSVKGPVLIVEGTCNVDVRDIKLHGEVSKKDLYWNNTSSESGKFRFEAALSSLPTEDTPWCWFHIYVYKGNASVASAQANLVRGTEIAFGATYNFNGVTYTVKAYNDSPTETQLVIQAVPD
ncbi:MAG: hypothetical protein NC132_05080 [Corallococcus sp.]|nr:hypothetical protein [Corallococcus sp.]MCM1360142.1 hypothetical protein [Corallococcus sp.]MCM1395470.1 hypothetical protein [Corallococcus sp.]